MTYVITALYILLVMLKKCNIVEGGIFKAKYVIHGAALEHRIGGTFN